jgi:hypothetical protein
MSAGRLNSAGVRNVRGFALNVSNFYTTSSSVSYAGSVNAALGYAAKFVVDTSRNGNGSNGVWRNPAGRKLGLSPQTGGGGAEMLLWVKTPGVSDGQCGVAPTAPAGQFSPDLAVRLINGHLMGWRFAVSTLGMPGVPLAQAVRPAVELGAPGVRLSWRERRSTPVDRGGAVRGRDAGVRLFVEMQDSHPDGRGCAWDCRSVRATRCGGGAVGRREPVAGWGIAYPDTGGVGGVSGLFPGEGCRCGGSRADAARGRGSAAGGVRERAAVVVRVGFVGVGEGVVSGDSVG